MLQITDEMHRVAAKVAGQWSLASGLASDDLLLQHIVRKWGPEKGIEHYFKGGRNDAGKVMAALQRLRLGKPSARVLDFAAGYGRVARHVKVLAPQHEIVASDIHPEACAFMRDALGLESHVSTLEPQQLSIGRDYDYIYVLSLFSHLPDHSFGRWLGALYDILVPGGFLLFTANGEATADLYPAFYNPIFDRESGFGFRPESDQPDIKSAEYGSMIVTMPYVLSALKEHCPTARLHAFQSGTWFASQDEWIVRKPS